LPDEGCMTFATVDVLKTGRDAVQPQNTSAVSARHRGDRIMQAPSS
jgi:hypothetical protein